MVLSDWAGPRRVDDRWREEFVLLDRRTERTAIDRVLDAVRSGFSGALVLRGGPGVGKSTLLRYAVATAPDLRVCDIAGIESEISMEFGGLHQLLVPFLPQLGDLPPPQRGALRVAFGREAGPPPERFLVGLATLTLLSRAAEEHPLLCVIDDAHWLDRESAQVLGFVARRLYADRVGFVAGVGEPAPQQVFEQLPTITVDGLPDAEARELLGSVVGGALNAQAVDRILADTRNNPLALVELGTRFAQGDAAEAARILASASQALAGDDRTARDTMLMALQAAIWAGPAQTREIARAARAFPPVSFASASVADLLLEGYSARFTLGYQASVEPFRAAVTALLADDLDPAVGLRWFALGTAAAGSLWDDQATFGLCDRWVKMARAAGAFTTLPVALAFHAFSESMAGHFREADTRWALMLEVLTMSCGPGVLGINSRSNGLLLAYRGQLTEARATGLAQVRESSARGQDGPADIGRYIVAVADLFGGDYAAAMSYAQTVIEDDPAYTAEEALPELIEAAVRAGDYEAAATAHKTLSERALAAGTPWALGLRARCEALLAEGADAEGCYLESISQLKRCRMAVDLARAHLLYGQWLRRAKRRRDARQELRTAHEMFAAIGADRFAERAAAELRATGERARARTPETAFDLTPQETRVADLAAAGASDSEIAAQLFISPSTVDYHLRKVFRKLNVTSRRQLAGRAAALTIAL